jgi:8-oxo-dGTP pyrophosphatase MutT (NUDIX family)
VILLRPAGVGYEVFMVRRLARAAAFADAFVFPGGSVGPEDDREVPSVGDLGPDAARESFAARGSRPPGDARLALALYRAGLRELFEEAGVLLARDASGRLAPISGADAPRWDELRREVQAGRLGFGELMRREGLALDERQLIYFSHWITPVGEPRRFDTRFFVARMPPEQVAAHCAVETTEGAWISPGEALERAARGAFPLVFPTRKHLEVLAAHPALEDALRFAATKPIRTVQPSRRPAEGEDAIPEAFAERAWW